MYERDDHMRVGTKWARVQQADWAGVAAKIAQSHGAERYPADGYERLARLKAAVDPANLFRCNLNIPPATRPAPRPGTPPTGTLELAGRLALFRESQRDQDSL